MTEKLNKIKEALSALKLKDIYIYDFQDFSPFFDYQVIATASNERQVHAAINHLKQAFPEVNIRVEGGTDNRWLLVDLEDVIVHVMHKDERDYYQIEKLFFERKQVEE